MNGIGNNSAEYVVVMGNYTIEYLLNYFPFLYDVFEVIPLQECVHDDQITIMGTVINEPSLHFYGRRKSRLTLTMEIDGIAIKVVMFNRAFAKKQINTGDVLVVTGKWDAHRLQLTASHYLVDQPDDQAAMKTIY